MKTRYLAALLLAGSLGAQAQPYRIGFLTPLPASPEPPTLRAFKQSLRDLGYIEGKTVVFEVRYADGRYERFPIFAAELVAQKVDVLLAGSEFGALAAKKATTTIPIVFAGVADPVNSGIVANLARPGGNVTGTTIGVGGVGFGGKWVELLREAVPGIAHVAILSSPANPQTALLPREAETAALKLGMKVDAYHPRDVAGLERAFAAIGASKARGLIVTTGPLLAANRARLVEFAAARRLPAIYFFRLFPDAGGLMSYGGSPEESYRRAAIHVDKILKGAKPADLPIEQPTRVELVVNLKAAKALGLALPKSIVARADDLIE